MRACRLLIALSLIMALLQFKPAPMYILDEIDAALDLSHTLHIGQLFRTWFKGVQFIGRCRHAGPRCQLVWGVTQMRQVVMYVAEGVN